MVYHAHYVENIVNVISNAATLEASKEVTKEASEGMFNGLIATVELDNTCSPEVQRVTWESTLRHGEDKWLEDNFSEMPEAKHKKGKREGQWKYRTLLPNPYTSAKSVIGNAIEKGISVVGKGKSAIQKEINGRDDQPDSSLDLAGKFTKSVDKAKALFEQVSDGAMLDACNEYLRKSFPSAF